MRGAHGLHGRGPLLRRGDPRYKITMPHQPVLADLLADTRERSADWNVLYDDFVGTLRRVGVGAGAPKPGEPFPAFALPDAAGHYRTLDALLAKGPLVLSFNRGGWCPYCSHELRAWNAVLPELTKAGGTLAAITPEVGGRAALMGRLLGISSDAELLCDVDSGVALASGLAFRLSEALIRAFAEAGLDLPALYGSASGFLPVPATFLIDREGVVRFASANPDFRERAEPADVIAALRALT